MKKFQCINFVVISLVGTLVCPSPVFSDNAEKPSLAQMTPLSQELLQLLEQQVASEYQSALFYLQQTVYFESLGLTGFSKWLKNHYTEELSHATQIMNYLLRRGARARIHDVLTNKRTQNLQTAGDIFEALLATEVSTTASFNQMIEKANQLQDQQTVVFLQTFAQKQIEEEYIIARILKKIRFINEDPTGLLDIDQELQRSTINEGVISAHYQILGNTSTGLEYVKKDEVGSAPLLGQLVP